MLEDEATGVVRARSVGWGARLALAFGTLLVGLALVEGALVLLGRYPAPLLVRAEIPGPGERALFMRIEGEERLVLRAPAAAVQGVRRVVVVGDSTIYGTHVEQHSTIPRLLQALLTSASGVPVEVLNLGLEGRSARELCELGAAALEHLAPDLLVVYTGHNEFLPVHIGDHFAAQRHPLRGLEGLLGSTRLGRALAARMERSVARPEAADGLRGALAGDILESSQTESVRARTHREFQRQLEELVRAGAALGIPVLLVGPASNGREYGPVGSAFSRPRSAAERARFVALLHGAVEHLHAGRFEACGAALDEASAIDARVAELIHLRAALLWATGQEQAARLLDLEKWALDESARAASQLVLDRIQAAARATGAPYVALGPQLERSQRPNEPALFLDHVHPSIYGQYLMALALAPACAAALDIACQDPWLEFDAACRALGIPPDFLAASELFKVRGDVVYACWAFDPLPYVRRARSILRRLGEGSEFALAGKLTELRITEVFLAILEEDAERVLELVALLSETRGRGLAKLLAPIEKLPRLQRCLERAGLGFFPDEPVPLRRLP